jgi:hypothetical protein
MFYRSKFPLMLVLALCVSLPGLFAQNSAGGIGPRSVADLDGKVRESAVAINQRLADLEGKVQVNTFSLQGSETSLGAYWRENLTGELANIPNRKFTLLSGGGRADYLITGEISDISNTVRIHTRLVKVVDSSIIASLTTDLVKTEFLIDLLDTGSAGISRDMYEIDSMDNPLAVTGSDWINRSIHNKEDSDWFLITAEKNSLLIVELSSDMDTYLELYDRDTREKLDEDDDSGSNSDARIEYQAEAGRKYIVKARGYSGDTGRYRFRAVFTDPPEDPGEPNNTREQATALEPNGVFPTYFSSRSDTDWYKLEIPSAGATVTIYTESHLDTIIAIYDAQGNKIDEDDDSGSDTNARISAPVPPGTLFIEVKELDGSRGAYTLHNKINQ